jgi:hypothetical protein
MSQRNLRNAIPATIVLTVLLSLLVGGQATTPPQPAQPKAMAKRKPTTRKTKLPPQPAQPVQQAQPAPPQAAPPEAAPSQPTQPQPAQPQPPQPEAAPAQPPQPQAQPQVPQAAPNQPPTVPAPPPPQALSPQPSSLPQPSPDPQSAPQSALPTTPANVAPATPGGAGASLSPKKPGVLRIGVVLPITQISPDASLALSDAIRQLLMSYLNGPIAEAIPLEARVPVQLEVEAKQKECDFVVYSAVGREQRSSSFAKIMKNATPVVGLIPGTGAATAAAGTATTAATTTDKVLKAATDLSGNIKAKDEVSVAFKLTAPGQATPKLNHTLKAKAKTDGDQVLSALLAEAANAVLQAATQK